MKLPAPLTSSQKPEFYGHRTSPMSTVLTLYRSACSWGLHIGDGLNHLKYQLLFICDHRSHSLLPSGILLFSFLGIHVRLIGNPVQFSEDSQKQLLSSILHTSAHVFPLPCPVYRTRGLIFQKYFHPRHQAAILPHRPVQ